MGTGAEEFKFEFEEEKLDESAMRQLVFDELTHYHPELRRQPLLPVAQLANQLADTGL